MHPAIPKSLLPDQLPSGLQLDDSFRCKPLPWTFYHYNNFSILGDGILEKICMKKIHGGVERGPIYFWLEDSRQKTGLLIRTLPQIHSFWNYLEIRNSLHRTHRPIKLFHTNAPSLQLGHNWSRPKSPDKELVAVYWLYVRDDMHAYTFPHTNLPHAAQTTC